MLILTVSNVSVGATTQQKKYCCYCLSHIKFEGLLKQKLSSSAIEAETPEAINFYIKELSKAILAAIAKSILHKVAPGKVTLGFQSKYKKKESRTN